MEIRSQKDADKLQADLDALQAWEQPVAHELSSPEVPAYTSHKEEITHRGSVLHPWPHAGDDRHGKIPWSITAQALVMGTAYPPNGQEGEQHPHIPIEEYLPRPDSCQDTCL